MAPSDFLPTTFLFVRAPALLAHTRAMARALEYSSTRVLFKKTESCIQDSEFQTILTATESGSHQQSGQLLVLRKKARRYVPYA